MNRVPFSILLKDTTIDYLREYNRLYGMFYLVKYPYGSDRFVTLKDVCAINFMSLPFRGTCISLDDFDDFYGYHFVKNPEDVEINELISFCEYTYNLAIYNQGFEQGFFMIDIIKSMNLLIKQVLTVIDAIGYMENTKNGITDFVPKDQAAISVSERIDSNLSYKVIEYNHHSMKGDLDRKKDILLLMANELEPQRNKLRSINSSLENDLFFLFNSVNLRHNNTDAEGKNYIPAVDKMNCDELEGWYDDIYQMSLLAFLEIDHLERKNRISKLKKMITDNV